MLRSFRVPPVPILVRMPLSFLFMGLAVALAGLANWLTPELSED